ncbi:MAG: hypothetical protein IPM57_08520 [Oligoflexia bacterium]|nr:hypothetical protein [Oligoflexia bacterium]
MPTQCPSGTHYVRAHDRDGYIRYDGVEVSPTKVSSHCRSNSSAYNKWIDKFIDSSPAKWPHITERFSKWTEAEKYKIIRAIEKLPEFLWRDSKRKIYRANKSAEGKNPSTSSSKHLVVYDTAFTDKHDLSMVLAHEFAHELYDQDSQLAKDYGLAMGWGAKRVRGKVLKIQRKSGYVDEDGKISAEEDFANNLEYFLFDPKKLKASSEPAYNWMRWKYGEKIKPISKSN